ncbi:hypothetical protein ACFQBQ_10515 [Granulicella cerasi]|uniref:DUF4190 domain-containing protein n=1 Tax=Granulicella cerasi TaxID=741063 RepID=A0ABW1ZAT0_9BACT|nr:hypothetical protein [Granulicella cerasi]
MATTPSLSFDKAVYEGDPAPPDACAYCGRATPNEYFRISGHLACSPCAQRAESLVPPDSHKAFTRALLFGAIAAVLGCIAYALFGIVTGISLGWAAIGVGFVVGFSMKKGSRGLGGKRYQIAAALLTYAAIAVAFVPIALHQVNEHRAQDATQRAEARAGKTAEADARNGTPQHAQADVPTGIGGFLKACALLLGIGLISPFLTFTASVGSGLINLFITFLGIQMAWRQMVSPRPEIEGPFYNNELTTKASL